MIKDFVDVWDSHKDELLKSFKEKHPDNYQDIFKILIKFLNKHTEDAYNNQPDPDRIDVIDHGDYQGYLLFIVGVTGYQPSTYFACLHGYGSCSGCDTFMSVRGYDDGPVTDAQAVDYLNIALHMLQRMKKISAYGDE